MRIGIDIDGCMTDIVRFVVDYGIKFCVVNNIQYLLKEDEYDEAKALGISYDETEKFWNEYLPYYSMEYKPRDFASEVINRLKENNEIFIITARNEEGLPPEYYGHMQELVKGWLKKYNINYDKLIFTKGSKLPYCLENDIDVMIEDSPYNVEGISKKIKVLCFDNPYNSNICNENIIRIYSWYDILNKIKSM